MGEPKDTMTDALADIFMDGVNAGGLKSANPHPPGTAEHFHWDEGWKAWDDLKQKDIALAQAMTSADRRSLVERDRGDDCRRHAQSK